jgi:Rps23 Pro-64 3,4-dihydroxylase Tpa1-like proline 4-hydroxylase
LHKFLTKRNWRDLREQFLSAEPFNHVVIDDFFLPEVAEQLIAEFPSYDSAVWNAHYNNPIENKKACNHWDKFPKTTYQVLHYLCSFDFENIVSDVTGNINVIADMGLHGGGWHAHTTAGNLNIHLDYSIHPKLQLERHYNLIVYLTPDWNPEWGGGLELWSHDNETGRAKQLEKLVVNKFNRAVLFDTTQNSWHGLPAKLNCPERVVRRSLAVYYVTEPDPNAPSRGKALFVPYKEQAEDPDILELIEKRSQVATAESVYKGLK